MADVVMLYSDVSLVDLHGLPMMITKAFSAFGDVVESKIINDRETGRSRGFGFVTFADEQSMRDTIEGMNE
ncbi:hypothetical protein C5167_050552 [Papaver somniferum]|uniref:RRM domain-containing protein n=1 Tax=Papaver somniferum TaxID=3469 RepID=A0A4Y7KSW6_PAPSO|nr:hypothetical protein C5167_050552 [Papaver somniferum]